MDKHKIALRILFAAAIVFGLALLYFVYDMRRHQAIGRTIQAEARELQYIYEEYDQDTGEYPSPFTMLRERTGNNDVIAYLYIPDTNISYAVLQSTDNDYYLHHDMYGNPSTYGALFLDYSNCPDFSDKNSVIYGHNMRNYTMFHNLRYFMDEDYFRRHRHARIITEHFYLVYEIFSAFSTDTRFNYIQTHFEEMEFESFVDALNGMSYHNFGAGAVYGDTILILSTCTNLNPDTRYVVAARLVETR